MPINKIALVLIIGRVTNFPIRQVHQSDCPIFGIAKWNVKTSRRKNGWFCLPPSNYHLERGTDTSNLEWRDNHQPVEREGGQGVSVRRRDKRSWLCNESSDKETSEKTRQVGNEMCNRHPSVGCNIRSQWIMFEDFTQNKGWNDESVNF